MPFKFLYCVVFCYRVCRLYLHSFLVQLIFRITSFFSLVMKWTCGVAQTSMILVSFRNTNRTNAEMVLNWLFFSFPLSYWGESRRTSFQKLYARNTDEIPEKKQWEWVRHPEINGLKFLEMESKVKEQHKEICMETCMKSEVPEQLPLIYCTFLQ